ncbi:anthranilate phosphoribosyltransferase, partial [Halobium palmae]
MKEYIRRVADGEDLTVDEARDAARLVFEEATEAQMGALLAGLRAKGETEAEIAGFAQG